MFNLKNLVKQLKSDGGRKGRLFSREIDGILYLTNSHYMAVMPVEYAMQTPIAPALIQIFGPEWINDKNLSKQYGQVGPCTLDVTKVIPKDGFSPIEILPFVYQTGKIQPMQLAVIPEQADPVCYDTDYVHLLESPIGTHQTFSKGMLYSNESYFTLIVCPFKHDPEKHPYINKYFQKQAISSQV